MELDLSGDLEAMAAFGFEAPPPLSLNRLLHPRWRCQIAGGNPGIPRKNPLRRRWWRKRRRLAEAPAEVPEPAPARRPWKKRYLLILKIAGSKLSSTLKTVL